MATVLPDRPRHVYPALLSTEADALAWARAGAPAGALVVAEYQASPRGRAGLEWAPVPGESLAFSLVVRSTLPAHREGWIYVAASCGLADVLGVDATLEWPDEAWLGQTRAGALGAFVQVDAGVVEWAVLNVLVEHAAPPRAPLLARAVAAIESRLESPAVPVLADYLRRCTTIGARVRARMIPLGPGGLVLEGRASSVLQDGALVLETDDGRRLAVRPTNLGLLERV